MAATKAKPKRKSENVTHLEIMEAAEALATPIDFDQLIAEGAIQKAGGGWFEVLDPSRMPDHAWRRIKAVKSGNRVRFRKSSKKLARFLESSAELQPQV
jgi:hypothetical protein